MELKSYQCDGKEVHYCGLMKPEDADLHLKIDEIKRYREHSDFYYLLKIFLKPGIGLLGRFELFNGLLDYDGHEYDYFEAVCKYYRKNVRKFVKQNKDSIIEIDCKNVNNINMPTYLAGCIAKDMGSDFIKDHIVVSSHNKIYDGDTALFFLGRIRRFK